MALVLPLQAKRSLRGTQAPLKLTRGDTSLPAEALLAGATQAQDGQAEDGLAEDLSASASSTPQLPLPNMSLGHAPGQGEHGSLSALAENGGLLTGRILELSGSTGRTTTAVSMLVAKQQEGEPVVWIEPTDGPLYPPDLAAAGVDLDALVIVRVPTKEGVEGLCRVAEWLIRSGGFGLVVMDLMGRLPSAHSPWQTRLSGLLRRHDAQLCVLSDSDAKAPSLGAMVALRLDPQRSRAEDGSFLLEHRVLKNKIGVTRAPAAERRRAPAGLESLPAEHVAPVAQLSLFDAPLDQGAAEVSPSDALTRLPISAQVPTIAPPIAPVVVRPQRAAKRLSARSTTGETPGLSEVPQAALLLLPHMADATASTRRRALPANLRPAPGCSADCDPCFSLPPQPETKASTQTEHPELFKGLEPEEAP